MESVYEQLVELKKDVELDTTYPIKNVYHKLYDIVEYNLVDIRITGNKYFNKIYDYSQACKHLLKYAKDFQELHDLTKNLNEYSEYYLYDNNTLLPVDHDRKFTIKMLNDIINSYNS